VEKDVAADHADQRKEAYVRSQNEAFRLAQLPASEGEDDDPGDDFEPAGATGQFVFSAPALLRVWSAASASTAPGISKSAPQRSRKQPKDANLTRRSIPTPKQRATPKPKNPMNSALISASLHQMDAIDV
jgi:hypothetical protein